MSGKNKFFAQGATKTVDSLSQNAPPVDTLKRKFAVELAVCKLRPLASEHCDQREDLVAEDKPPPNPHPLFKKLKNLPGKDFLRRLIPRAEDRGLIPRRYASTPHYWSRQPLPRQARGFGRIWEIR